MQQRETYFDNAKFILIAFVVFGHLLNTYIHDSNTIEAIYKTIYSFHMPAFILISGLFAKGFYKKGYILKLTKKLILPYIIFQLIYTIFYYFLFDYSTFNVDIFDPQWALWFLISLFCWNIMLLGFAKLNPTIGIALAIVIALLAGYIDSISNYLSLSRTLVFFPLFLIGYHMRKDYIKKLTETHVRITAFAIIAVTFIGFYLFPEINYKWLLGSKPYAELEEATLISMFKRLGLYGLSLIMVCSFLSLIPRGKYFFTNWGKQTLYVYLLHGFVIRTFRESEIHEYFNSVESFIILACVSLLLTIVLSSQFIAKLAEPIIEIRMTFYKELLQKYRLWRNKRKRTEAPQ